LSQSVSAELRFWLLLLLSVVLPFANLSSERRLEARKSL